MKGKTAILLYLFLFFAARFASAGFLPPGNLNHTANTTNSITWVWDDNSDDEQGFTCYSWSWGNIGTDRSGWIRGSKV